MRLYSIKYISLPVLVSAMLLFSCGGGGGSAGAGSSEENLNLDYTVHQIDEDLKWLTNDSDPVIASPDAKKGGTFNMFILSFPLTFRCVGPDSNSSTRSFFLDNQMSLIDYHGDTERIIPAIATHWAYGKDGKTMYFKINPDAKWSDGKPVTADDFIYTIEFMRSKHIQDPWYNDYYTKDIEKVTKHGDHIVSVTATKRVPELWLTVSLSPTPKHYYVKLNSGFVSDYNWKIVPNTGPYILKDYSKGKYLLFERKKDWWARDLRYYKNRFNVDFFKLNVLRDVDVAYEYFKKGKLDYYGATRAAVWHEKGKGELFDNGYIEKVWFYNQTMRSPYGLYLNLDNQMFKDKNLRYALAHAINFEKVNRQILRGEASRLQTFYSGYGKYTNQNIKAREYSITKTESLMKGSGWKRGDDGIWTKDGRRFSVTLSYGQALLTPRVVVMKEEAKKAGIELNLELLDPSNNYKKIMEKKHEVAYMGWGTGLRPQPWEHFHSANAHVPQTNNVNNLDDPEMDKLIDSYRSSTDEKELVKLAHKIQERVHESGGWIPLDTLPFFRSFCWRWVKYPSVPGYKNATEIFDQPSSAGYFWIDEDIKNETLEAMKANKKFKPVVNMITKYKKGN